MSIYMPSITSTVNVTTTVSSEYTQNSNKAIISFPTPGCILTVTQSYSRIVNTIGLSLFNVSMGSDYVIQPGNTGKISYTIYLANSSFAPPQNQSAKLNITNMAQLFNTTPRTYNVITPEMTWWWASNVSDSYGINISYNPTSELLTYNNRSKLVNVSISVESNAPEETYWMLLSPGPCGGGPETLLTIGKNPLNRSVNWYPGLS